MAQAELLSYILHLQHIGEVLYNAYSVVAYTSVLGILPLSHLCVQPYNTNKDLYYLRLVLIRRNIDTLYQSNESNIEPYPNSPTPKPRASPTPKPRASPLYAKIVV